MSKIVSDFLAEKFTRIRVIALIFTFILIMMSATFATTIPNAMAACNNPPSIMQCGVVQLSIPINANSVFQNVFFPVKFNAIPNITATAEPPTAGDVGQITASSNLLFFQSVLPTGQVWTIQTDQSTINNELFNSTAYRKMPDTHNGLTSQTLSILFLTGSMIPSGETVTVSVKCSIDAGTTWSTAGVLTLTNSTFAPANFVAGTRFVFGIAGASCLGDPTFGGQNVLYAVYGFFASANPTLAAPLVISNVLFNWQGTLLKVVDVAVFVSCLQVSLNDKCFSAFRITVRTFVNVLNVLTLKVQWIAVTD